MNNKNRKQILFGRLNVSTQRSQTEQTICNRSSIRCKFSEDDSVGECGLSATESLTSRATISNKKDDNQTKTTNSSNISAIGSTHSGNQNGSIANKNSNRQTANPKNWTNHGSSSINSNTKIKFSHFTFDANTSSWSKAVFPDEQFDRSDRHQQAEDECDESRSGNLLWCESEGDCDQPGITIIWNKERTRKSNHGEGSPPIIKPVNWNGSFLGVIQEEDVIIRITEGSTKYIQFRYNKKIYTARIKKLLSSAPVLIDEYKSIFGLPKIGTHRIQIGNKYHILFRVKMTSTGDIQEEYGLDKCPIDRYTSLFHQQIQNIYAFREIVGVTSSFDSSIKIRTMGIGYFPYSYKEPNFTATFQSSVISNTILERWFQDISMQEAIRKLLNIEAYESLPDVIHMLRSKLENVTMRVDPDYVWVVDSICQRIVDRIYD